jgi:hypothetical protein
MKAYREASQYSAGAKLLREEGIGFEGANVNCYVVSLAEKENGLELGGSTRRVIEFCERTQRTAAWNTPLSSWESRSRRILLSSSRPLALSGST